MAIPILDPNAPDFTRRYVNLADPRLGAQALEASDDFFAPKERMLNPEPARLHPRQIRRPRQVDGRLGNAPQAHHRLRLLRREARAAGRDQGHRSRYEPLHGQLPAGGIDRSARVQRTAAEPSRRHWTEIVPSTTLQGNQPPLSSKSATRNAYTHLRVNIYPDGGIARLRVYGQPQADWARREPQRAVRSGRDGKRRVSGRGEQPAFRTGVEMLMPGRGVNMGDGWETRRRREPGNDWAIVALAQPGVIRKIEVDTAHFKGNFPDRCSLQAAYVTGGTDSSLVTQAMFWPVLLGEQKLQMDNAALLRERKSRRSGPSRTCASTSFRTAAYRVCACSATSRTHHENAGYRTADDARRSRRSAT